MPSQKWSWYIHMPSRHDVFVPINRLFHSEHFWAIAITVILLSSLVALAIWASIAAETNPNLSPMRPFSPYIYWTVPLSGQWGRWNSVRFTVYFRQKGTLFVLCRVFVCISKKNRIFRFFSLSGGEEFVYLLYVQTQFLFACREQYPPQQLASEMLISRAMICSTVVVSVASSSATAFKMISRPLAVPKTLYSQYTNRTQTSRDFIYFTIFYNNLSVSRSEIRNFLRLLCVITYFIPLNPCFICLSGINPHWIQPKTLIVLYFESLFVTMGSHIIQLSMAERCEYEKNSPWYNPNA